MASELIRIIPEENGATTVSRDQLDQRQVEQHEDFTLGLGRILASQYESHTVRVNEDNDTGARVEIEPPLNGQQITDMAHLIVESTLTGSQVFVLNEAKALRDNDELGGNKLIFASRDVKAMNNLVAA